MRLETGSQHENCDYGKEIQATNREGFEEQADGKKPLQEQPQDLLLCPFHRSPALAGK